MPPRQPDPAQPPPPPEIHRRLDVSPGRWLGLAGIAAVPVLALLGVFGERWNTISADNGALTLEVDYASRYRYKMINSIAVRIRNQSAEALDTVTVSFDTAYIQRFSNVSFTPSAEAAYEVPLTDLEPGETRLVSVELQGERYGRHAGAITAAAGDGPPVSVRVHTTILP